MKTEIAKKILPVPKTRNPFVNNNLLPCGKNKEGKSRYWISSVNNVSGPMGLVITSDGQYKIIEFSPEKIGRPDPDMCYYAAAYVGNDTVFLTSRLSEISSINIETGEYRRYPTGAPYTPVFAGMNFDENTGKILYSGAVAGKGMCSVSFDINTKKTKLFYTDEGFYCYEGFPNGDGTQTQTFYVYGEDTPSFIHVRWDPKADTLIKYADVKRPLYRKFIFDEYGRVYYGSLGWLDGRTGNFYKGAFCGDDNICFFSSDGKTAFGTRVFSDRGVTKVYKWDIKNNILTEIFTVPHAQMNVFETTEDGNILAVNMYAELFIFDANGKRLLYKEIKADSAGLTDTCIRIDEKTLLGTPFITQRFWLADTVTGKGIDAGRAAPNEGEVLMAWSLNGTAYMAGYTTGALTEYTHGKTINFPDNPRVVIEPPTALRLTCGACDGRNIFYACSRRNGMHGSVVVKYDSLNDKAESIVDILHGQQIYSLMYDQKRDVLVAGTTFYADGFIQKPIADKVYLMTISVEPFGLLHAYEMPKGYKFAGVFGRKDEDTYFI
ncbi:MAG: hypothetical protein J5697_02830, partial [Clostridia bacterium]|nr:hypothetical protein [Clostridia bacterium]